MCPRRGILLSSPQFGHPSHRRTWQRRGTGDEDGAAWIWTFAPRGPVVVDGCFRSVHVLRVYLCALTQTPGASPPGVSLPRRVAPTPAVATASREAVAVLGGAENFRAGIDPHRIQRSRPHAGWAAGAKSKNAPTDGSPRSVWSRLAGQHRATQGLGQATKSQSQPAVWGGTWR